MARWPSDWEHEILKQDTVRVLDDDSELSDAISVSSQTDIDMDPFKTDETMADSPSDRCIAQYKPLPIEVRT
jgi:hypothetical protein